MLMLNLSPAGSDKCSGPIYRHGGFANSIVDSPRICIQQVHVHTQWSCWPLARCVMSMSMIHYCDCQTQFIFFTTHHRTQTLGHLPDYCVICLSMDYIESVWKVLQYYYSYKKRQRFSGNPLCPWPVIILVVNNNEIPQYSTHVNVIFHLFHP